MKLEEFKASKGYTYLFTGKKTLEDFLKIDPICLELSSTLKWLPSYAISKYFFSNIEPNFKESVEVYYYDDIGILCGSKGYLFVENGEIIKQLYMVKS